MENLLKQIEKERQEFRAKVQVLLQPCLGKYDTVSIDVSISSLGNEVMGNIAEDAGWTVQDTDRAVWYRSARESSPSGGDTIIYSQFKK